MPTSTNSNCIQIRCGSGCYFMYRSSLLTSLVETDISPFIGNHKQSKINRVWANSISLEG